uniref:Secreted protein n=1 Tax=Bursaphelenchus xylophilus TaxID=6326 RepID=A0A1I7RJS1_BURXY
MQAGLMGFLQAATFNLQLPLTLRFVQNARLCPVLSHPVKNGLYRVPCMMYRVQSHPVKNGLYRVPCMMYRVQSHPAKIGLYRVQCILYPVQSRNSIQTISSKRCTKSRPELNNKRNRVKKMSIIFQLV